MLAIDVRALPLRPLGVVAERQARTAPLSAAAVPHLAPSRLSQAKSRTSASEARSPHRGCIPHCHLADGFLALSISSRQMMHLSHTYVIQVRQAPMCTASAGAAMKCQASVPHPSEHSLRLGREASLMIRCVARHAVPPQRYATPFQHSSARTPRFVVSWCGVSPRRTTSLRARGAVPSRSASSPRL